MRRTFQITALLALSPAVASASVPDLFGYGPRGLGMASTLTATAAGAEAVYYNPAGLAFSTRPDFALGFQRTEHFLSIDGQGLEADPSSAITIGLQVPLPFGGVLANRLAIGFGFVIPQTAVLLADIPRPDAPRFVRVRARAETVSLMGAIGVRIIDELAIGVGFVALSELTGAIEVAPNDAGNIGSSVRDELIADFSPVVGVMARPLPWLSVGAVYRDQSVAEFALPIKADLGEDFPLEVPLLQIEGIAQFDPTEVAVAVAVRPLEPLLVTAELVWERWSTFENPIVFTAVPADYPAQPDPNFSDVFAGRVAAEALLAAGPLMLTPRLGFAVEPTPVPVQDGFHNYLDSTRLITTGGLRCQWRMLRMDLAAQWHFMPGRRHEKSDGSASIEGGGSMLAWMLELGLIL